MRPLFIVLASWLFSSQAWAQTPAPLFGLQPGNSRYAEASQLWQQGRIQLQSEFYGNAQDGFLAARPENIPNRHVVRATVNGLTNDGGSTCQLSFFDDVLYQLSCSYPAAQGEALRQTLTSRYGPPAHGLAGWLWPQGALSIALQQHTSGSYGLIWQHEGLARRVATSNTEAYAAHIRQRGISTAMPAP